MWFDLASLTKPLVTTPLALKHLDLDRDLRTLPVLSDFRNRTWPLTARQLLSHTAGLPPWLPYNGVPLAQQLAAPFPWNRHPLLVKPVAEFGEFPACYSDLGFRVLAEAVEAVSGGSWAKLGQQMTGLVPAPWSEAPITLPPGPDQEAWLLAANNIAFPEGMANLPHDANARAGMIGHAGFAANAQLLLPWLMAWRTTHAPNMALAHARSVDGTVWGLGLWRVLNGPGQFGELLERLPLNGICRVIEFSGTDMPPHLPNVPPTGISQSWWMHTGFTGPAMFFRPDDASCICLLAHRRGPEGGLLDPLAIHRRRYAMLTQL
ncbi:MAG: serine hydrolase domain-containing protein [Candidatus Accumulibacter phosphatis]|jgi:CubicO group peptidase (beta-lactamase class C family)|uniref:Class A beta-lactamase-related serine hydrolase n=2 Tax=Candidatus Accumulibacter contiguus TaxID=2954381 RepID=A0ABX1T479_9PROT|nr:serine hydrolase domain-containing protein [Candidatus Accumulibacter contiguus]NMQ04429.1 class A beta-lactamase-related serine hydrolase [Candidatus Accumulibacter contiguus]